MTQPKTTPPSPCACLVEQLLRPLTDSDVCATLRNRPAPLRTGYAFVFGGNDTEELTLPVGALTLVCAPTSHGKSTMLQNLLLRARAHAPSAGTFLYFTMEEDVTSVTLQLLNKYADVDLTETGSNNSASLEAYFRDRSGSDLAATTRGRLETAVADFFKLLADGVIRIVEPQTSEVTVLCDAIQELSSKHGISMCGLFIDYIQLLRHDESSRERRLEMAEVCGALNALAKALNIPVVLAAQLNRMASSPLELHAQNIAEAADIERYANTIVALWNSAFLPRCTTPTERKSIDAMGEQLGIAYGTPGHIYAKLLKRRGGRAGGEAVWPFNGNTGVIGDTATEAPTTVTQTDEEIFAAAMAEARASLKSDT